jgi:phosphopentomutase
MIPVEARNPTAMMVVNRGLIEQEVKRAMRKHGVKRPYPIGERQQQVLDELIDRAAAGHPIGTIAEVGRVVGISTARAGQILANLKRRGLWRWGLENRPFVWRTS